ncbi:hypothetical protein REH65_32385 [Saccharopolyspora sp. ID03-671]|uniref:hypothetical protein n=1 Tax=Saccharopolyspora sp. ID03-671 TaxID=3073066 RepID=UPI0032513654
MTTPNAAPSYYDPADVLAEVFDDETLADDLAAYLTCVEANVLAGFLDSTGRHDGAQCWLRAHRVGCNAPHRH